MEIKNKEKYIKIIEIIKKGNISEKKEYELRLILREEVYFYNSLYDLLFLSDEEMSAEDCFEKAIELHNSKIIRL